MGLCFGRCYSELPARRILLEWAEEAADSLDLQGTEFQGRPLNNLEMSLLGQVMRARARLAAGEPPPPPATHTVSFFDDLADDLLRCRSLGEVTAVRERFLAIYGAGGASLDRLRAVMITAAAGFRETEIREAKSRRAESGQG